MTETDLQSTEDKRERKKKDQERESSKEKRGEGEQRGIQKEVPLLTVGSVSANR